MSNTASLLRAIARGDQAAFTQLYRATSRRLIAYAAGLLAGDRDAAEDVVDAAYIAVWQGAGQWSGQGSADGWLRRIVRNKAVDWLRASGRYQLGLDLADLAELLDLAPDPEQAAMAGDAAERLTAALAGLSLDQRDAVMLCYYEDLPLGEIARACACPEGTVKTRLFHARKALRRALGPLADSLRELQ